MKLDEIELSNFRNIASMTVSPCPGINVICGDNAQGKTNLMEAVWLFTGNASFRGAKSGELIRFGETGARLSIRFSDRRRQQTASLSFLSAPTPRRRILVNGVECRSSSDLMGQFYAVVFSPSHLSLVRDGPKYRRKFLDIAIAQIRPRYAAYLAQYDKLVEQRNALLKDSFRYPDLQTQIEVWDEQLARAGTVLSLYRSEYVQRLSGLAAEIYGGLSSGRERLSVSYESTVFGERIGALSSYEDAWVEAYRQRLRESFVEDVRQGFTGAGPHRDDLTLEIDGVSARLYGSQGQQRSSVIALKLAEARLLETMTGEEPVMLLDDVMSELDVSRQTYILNHLRGMQVFITCCDPSNVMRLETGTILHIARGSLRQQACLPDRPADPGNEGT